MFSLQITVKSPNYIRNSNLFSVGMIVKFQSSCRQMVSLGWPKPLKYTTTAEDTYIHFLASHTQDFLETSKNDITLISCGNVSQRKPGRLSKNNALQVS